MATFVINPAEFPPLTRSNSADFTRPTTETQPMHRKSFVGAATHAKSQSNSSDSKKFFLADSNPTTVGTKSYTNGRPTLAFSDVETEELAAPFKLALIGKFSHGAPLYRNLHRLIAGLGIQGGFTVSMINAKHALISLSKESDYTKLWLKRIWYLQGFPMRIFKWTPTFTPGQETSVVPIWACLPELPAHLFHKTAIFTIASMIGTPLQIDDSTLNQSKLSKARICVEIDLNQPLVEELDLLIHGAIITQKVEYEQVPLYCTMCKHVGHKDTDCYTKGNAPKPPARSKKYQTKGKNIVESQAQQVLDKMPETNPIDARKVLDNIPVTNEKGECSTAPLLNTNITEHVRIEENVVQAIVESDAIVEVDAENDILIVDVIPENAPIDVHAENEACFVVNENVEGAKEPHNDGVVSSGTVVLRPDKFICDLMKRTVWIKVERAFKLFETFKQFGVVIKGIEENVEDVIKRNTLAIRSGMLYQKCVLIFDRVSQLYIKPLDERSPPIATRTRRRKKGKNSF
ncbi:UNVERIFIED_CONTAM: hypothetical protein Sradi_1694600 [Sesamum radiatum]|uniref:DUF4283 domain-containing protein n=1 Tax=Sesamum radiatum TaxID=300843 RepID=A0AAW2TTN6_SESRA